MKNKIITLSLALLCSIVISKAYSMEKENDAVDMSADVDLPVDVFQESMLETMDTIIDSAVKAEFNQITTDGVNEETVKNILQNGVKNEKGQSLIIEKYGIGALENAIDEEKVSIVKLLLANGVNLYGDCLTYTTSLFERAMDLGNEGLIRCFLEYGYDVKHRGDEDRTALSYAVYEMLHPNIIKLLLKYGADPEELKDHALTDVFEEIGGRSEADEEGITPIDALNLFYEYGVDINMPGTDGKTALAWAIENAEVELVSALCERKADVLPSDLKYAQQKYEKAEKYKQEHKALEGAVLFDQCPVYKQIIEIIADRIKEIEKQLKEVEKQQKILSFGAYYNKQAFGVKHEFNVSSYKNAEKIEELSETLLRAQDDGRDLSPYISTRAPKMLEFMNYIKVNGSSADKESKRFKN